MHGGTFDNKPVPPLETINEHASKMYSRLEAEMVKEKMVGDDLISQNELEALIMFKELRLKLKAAQQDTEAGGLKRLTNITFNEQPNQDDILLYFKQKHNRFRGVQRSLRVERNIYRLETILQHEQTKQLTVDEEIAQKLKYLEIYRHQIGASIEELNQKDPKVQFFKECRKSVDLALPLFDKILAKTLCLQNYSLTTG
jgi:hypothetical protein